MRTVAKILRQAGAYVERPRPPKPRRHRATCEEQRAIQVRKAAFARLRRLVRPVEQQDAPAEEVCQAYEASQKAAEAVRALRRNQGRTSRRRWLRRLAAQLRNPLDKRQGFRTIRLQLSDTPRYPPARNVTRMDRTGITTCHQEAAEQFRVYFSILAQDQEDKGSRLTQENLRFWHERLKTWQTAVTGLTFPSTPFRTGPETSLAPDRSNWATKPLGSLDDPVTQEEVTDTLKGMPYGKAAGLDLFPYDVWKVMIGRYESEQRQRERREAAAREGAASRPPGQRTTSRPTTLTDTMTALLNVVFCRATLPDLEEWRCSRCIPLPKIPTPTHCTQYRPISLMHCGLKILLKALSKRLTHSVERSGRVGPWQAGFRPNHHCAEQVLAIREIVDRRKQHGLDTWVCFVDFAKAYDSVPQTTIMPNCGISGYVEHSSSYWRSSTGRPRCECK